MGRRVSTHFNPSLGIRYYVKDVKSGNEIVGKTLSSKNLAHKKHMPARSNNDTPKGEEFFKMEIDEKIHKFLNSIQYDKCLSENGKLEFTGKRPNGKSLVGRKKPQRVFTNEVIEFVAEDLKELLAGV